MTRKQWESSIKKPISIIPCGTGNGFEKILIFNISHQSVLRIQLVQQQLKQVLLLSQEDIIDPLMLIVFSQKEKEFFH